MRYLVLTVDYEVFGNGTGDVRRHVVEPTERMARLAERYGAPLTVFFEAEEYLAFERETGQLEPLLGYSPARLMREQVADLSRCGHDFQLHIHPQWHGAFYAGGKWRLRWDKETVDDLLPTIEDTRCFVLARKALLESLASGNGRGHRVMAYRAGGFSARPGGKLLTALAENGFEIESSLVKGLHRSSPHYALDYRDVRTPQRLWRIGSDVGVEDLDGPLWEIPIYSVMGRRYQQATLRRLRAKFSRHVPQQQQGATVRRFVDPRHPVRVLRSFWEPVPIKLDFHNLGPVQLLRMIDGAGWTGAHGPLDVMVSIGHTKEHIDDQAFERFLALVAADPGVKVVTFSELGRLLRELPVCPKEWPHSVDGGIGPSVGEAGKLAPALACVRQET